VFKGKRMPGHLGNVKRTIPNLEIVRIDETRQLLLVKGSVPGSSGRDVLVRLAAKGQPKPRAQQAAPKAAPKAEPKAAPKADAKPGAKPAAKQPAPKA
jgi:hypothetical protein